MSISGRILLGLTQGIRGSRCSRIMQEISLVPHAPRPEILSRQFHRLSTLLQLAEAHVPYYREMFRTTGIRSRDIRSLHDFALLPVLTKNIVRERLADLVREDIPKDKLIPGNTGGSTGIPLTFYRDRSVLDAQDAATYRNLLQCGWVPGDMIGSFWGADDHFHSMKSWEFELRQRLRRQYQFDPFQSGTAEFDRWLKKWKKVNPSIALGYASTIARFAAYIEDTGQRLGPLKGAYTTAEKIYPSQREVISRVFGCPVYSVYGSSEVPNIASECPRGKMHVNSDFVILETERSNENGHEPSPFLVTGLWNQVMPFIRYRNDDCGALSDQTCDCGKQFPLMDLNIARTSDNFIFPNGQVVHGEFFTHLMYGSKGIQMFQFHQTAQDSITLWIVPNPGQPKGWQQSIRAVQEKIENLDSTRRLKVHVQETEAIPVSPVGKHRFTRSDVKLSKKHAA
jgi:phenylacetate-CoA ligase